MRSDRVKSTTVLVVEDEPTIRALAASVIESLGWRTLSAANAREAIALLNEDHSIEILFTDINLPDGPDAVDGLELARRAIALRPELRVIYTTGCERTDGMSVLMVDGAVFLAKPYTNEQLIRAVKTR